jgi:hypothetical protein
MDHRNLYQNVSMGNPAVYMRQKWQPIATAPANAALELSIYDKGEYHALAFPCERQGTGWRDVRTNRSLFLTPTHWRLWDQSSAKRGFVIRANWNSWEPHMDWDDYLRDEARKYRKLAEEANDPLIKQEL